MTQNTNATIIDTPRLQAFLTRHDWQVASPSPVAPGASTRHFFRLTKPDGTTAILMDTGGEDKIMPTTPYEQTIMPTLAPFARVASVLESLGFSAPKVYAQSEDNHSLLVEDFGEREFIRLLRNGAEPAPLLSLAVDTLINIQHKFAECKPDMTGLRHYTPEFFLSHLAVIPEIYIPMMCGAPLSDGARNAFDAVWLRTLSRACATPATLMLRDFAISNSFHLPERPLQKTMGLIDFETAGTGPILYDLSSILRDNRHPLPLEAIGNAKSRFLKAFPNLDALEFDAAEHIFAAMRQIQWAGSCTLYTRQGRDGFLKNLPGIWSIVETVFAHSALAEVKDWFDTNIPRAARSHTPTRATVLEPTT